MFQINTLSREELEERAAARKLRGLFCVSHDDYHAGPGWSSTRLKRVLEQSPAHALVPIDDTPSLAFGRAVHVALLEPETFAECYVWEPQWPKFAHDGRTAEGKLERSARALNEERWLAEHGHKVTLSLAEFETIACIMAAAGQSAQFRRLVSGATFELACYWVDPDTNVQCKAKADIWNGSILADVKTTLNASKAAFRRSIHDYDYDLSASFYSDGFGQVLGMPMTFVWIPVEKRPPFGVAFYVADDEMKDNGRALYKRALEIVSAIPKGAAAPCYPDEIQAISPTPYARNRINENQ